MPMANLRRCTEINWFSKYRFFTVMSTVFWPFLKRFEFWILFPFYFYLWLIFELFTDYFSWIYHWPCNNQPGHILWCFWSGHQIITVTGFKKRSIIPKRKLANCTEIFSHLLYRYFNDELLLLPGQLLCGQPHFEFPR